MLVYLADLTHVNIVVASNVMPLSVGLIGANILREIPGAEVELFKYPEDLARALASNTPDVVGFSNYSWCCNLGMAYAERIKKTWPQVVIIAGGPNYGSTEEEQEDYWQRFPFVDFYIVKEGEQAVVQLLSAILEKKRSLEDIRVPSTHRLQNGRIRKEGLLPRVADLDLLPSPYTCGLMDKFFDGILIPLMHTTRGCPFSCSFCTEGTAYYNKVAKRSTLIEDLTYVGQRKGTLQDLYLSDANVGMFKEDADKARAIRQTQDKYGWPKYIHCSAGKNHKERVLEFAEIVGGGMGVAASLQSTSKTVLDNVKRSNISVDQLTEVARRGSRIDANTYSEIILNLPGDTVEAHTQSLRDCVNSGISYLRMYQLIMLPETDMNTRETREKFGLKTMWRIMPRCFGKYTFQQEEFNCAEIEEIVVAQDSLSFEDYVGCRELDLTIEIFHNANVFREVYGLCQMAGVEWFQLLLCVHERRREWLPDLYRVFRHDTISPLWQSREQALDFAQSNLDLYLTEQMGTNELFAGKAVAFFNLQEQLHDAIYSVAQERFPDYAEYLQQAKDFSVKRKGNLLDTQCELHGSYDYDFPALVEADFAVDPNQHRRRTTVAFRHNAEQRATIEQLVRQYGTSTTGLGRILLRSHVKKLFREISVDGTWIDKGFENSYRRSSNLAGD